MADSELNVRIHTIFDEGTKLGQDIAKNIQGSGMSKKQVSVSNQKLAGLNAQLEQLFNLSDQMDPQEVLSQMRKIFTAYSKLNSSLVKYSAETQAAINEVNSKIDANFDAQDKNIKAYESGRKGLGSIRYKRDESGEVIGVNSLTFGSNDIVNGNKDLGISGLAAHGLANTDIKTRADLVNAQNDDTLTAKQKEAAAAYLEEITTKEQALLDKLNTELELTSKLKEEEADLSAQKDRIIEKANIPDTNNNENIALAQGKSENLVKQTNDLKQVLVDKKSVEKEDKNAVKDLTNAQKEQSSVIAKAIKSFFGYQQVIRALRTVVNFTVKTITDLDKALTDQAIVSGLTRKQTWDLVSSYAAMAKQTGFTTTEIAQTASKFLQQGKTVAETLKLTKAAAESARVAGISASQAVDYLTTALNGFQMSADQSLEVSDKFAAVAASSATSYQELATALSKVASQANLAGMSMDYTLALLAKGIETTRESAESIGTALKTVVARMREITDYGKTLEDGIDVNNVETQLKAVGISLRDNNGELRSTQDVLNEVGLKWKDLSSNQQAALAKALAGTRQQSRLISMMDNYDRTLELLEISQNSLGATEAQQAKYMQSMAAATNNVQVAWQDLVTAFTNADAIIDVVNLFADLIETVKDNMTGLSVVMFTMIIPGLIAMKIATVSHTIAIVRHMSAEKAGQALENAGLVTTLLTIAATKHKTKATWADTVAQLGLNAALYACPIVWILALIVAFAAAIALVTIGIIAFMKHLGAFESKQEKAIKNMKALTAEAYNFKKTASDFESVIDAFDKVDEKVIKTKDDIDSLNSTADKTKELLNNLNTSDERNTDLLTAIFGTADKDTIENLIKSASPEQLKKYAQLAGDASKKKANEANRKVISTGINTEGVLDTAEGLALTKNAVASVGNDSISEVGKTADMTEEQIANVKLTWQSMVNSMDATDFVGKTDQQVAEMGKDFADYMSGINRNTLNAFYDSSADIETRVAAYNTITKNMSKEMKDNFDAAYPEFKLLMDNYGKAISNGIISGLGISVDSLNTFNKTIVDVLSDAGEKLANGLTTDDLMNDIGSLVESGASFEQIISELTTKFGVSEASALKIAAAMGVAASNGKTLLDSTEQQSSLTSKASNLRETQGKWASMSDAEKNEYIASHSDFFQQSGAREAFESGANITSYIKGAYGKDQQDLIKQYKAQALAARADIDSAQKEIDAAIAAGDEVALKTAQEKKAAAEEEYREAVEFQKDALDMFNMSLDDIVTKQQSQIKLYKDYLKQQQTDLTNSLNARKEAYQDYFDAINAAYEETDFATEEARLQQQIVKLSGGTDATSQNKVLDLQNQLSTLEKNHSETTVKNAQQAVLDNIDDEISVVNNYYNKMLNSNKLMLNAMNTWLAQGKSQDEYKQYLEDLGYTDDEVTQAMKTFTSLTADGKVAESSWVNANTDALDKNTTSLDALAQMQAYNVAQSLAANNGLSAPEIIKEGNNTYIQFNNKRFELNGDQATSLSDLLVNLMKAAKTTTGV